MFKNLKSEISKGEEVNLYFLLRLIVGAFMSFVLDYILHKNKMLYQTVSNGVMKANIRTGLSF